jgi:hypothetical protein
VTDTVDRREVVVEDPYSTGKARLLAWIAAALRTRAVLHQQRGGRVNAVTLVGFSSDLQRVEVHYTSLLLQATAELVRLRPPSHRESVTAYRRSWLHGFAVAVHQRLSTAERHAEQERADPDRGDDGASTGVALVLADRRVLVDQAFGEAFPRLSGSRRPQLTGSGLAAGHAAGSRADLGSARMGGGPRGALGA